MELVIHDANENERITVFVAFPMLLMKTNFLGLERKLEKYLHEETQSRSFSSKAEPD